MVYNEQLTRRIRAVVVKRKGLTEKKMFGGVAFMLDGNMFCGVVKNDLLVRVGAERNDEALVLPHARPMDFTGKPMKGFIYVNPKGWSEDAVLRKWINMGISYTSLPKK